MKKFFRIITVFQMAYQGYTWYQERQKNKNVKKRNEEELSRIKGAS